MKKTLIFTILFGLILLPAIVFAQGKPDIGIGQGSLLKDAAATAQYGEQTSETTFASTLGTVVRLLVSFSGIIFMSLMIYAGFLWMTARGEEAQIDKSMKLIKASIIGLVIVVSAYSITFFIVPRILLQTAPPG